MWSGQIILKNMSNEEETTFTYDDWLSKTKGEKRQLSCELAAVVDEEEMVDTTTYIIQVKTSDVTGMFVIGCFWCKRGKLRAQH